MLYKKYIEFINTFNYLGHLLLNYQLISILFVIVFTSHITTLSYCENLDNQNIIEEENKHNSNLTKNEGLCLFIFMTVIYIVQIYIYLYNNNLDINEQLSEISEISNTDFNLDIAASKLFESSSKFPEDLPISSNPILESQKIPSIETLYTEYYAEEK